MTIIMIIAAIIMIIVLVTMLLERRKARDASGAALDAVTALADVAKHAHELAEMDIRTAVSMEDTFYGTQRISSFPNERNPSAQRAKMRGYEVYRNERIGPVQQKLRAAYQRYESATRRLIATVQRSAVRHAIVDFEGWRDERRAKRERTKTSDHPHHDYDLKNTPIFEHRETPQLPEKTED